MRMLALHTGFFPAEMEVEERDRRGGVGMVLPHVGRKQSP